MIFRVIIAVTMAVYATSLTLRHNLHMFQLNGYKNGEHIHWLKKNLRQQWLLYFGLAVGVIRLFVPVLGLDILIYLTLFMDILVYRALHRLNNKTPLKYTARVKRLIVTMVLLCAVMSVALFFGFGWESLSGIAIIVVSVQWFFDILANIVNHPIEKGISNWYINDAKKRLKSMPNLKVIGITGSYGKTSMKYYLKTLLQNKYNVLMTPGNFNTPLGVTITVRRDLKPTHEIFLCEMGARHVGDIKEVCDIAHPDMGIITSIGPQHLETFFTMENIQKTKFELADALPAGGKIFLNGDNEYIQEKAQEYENTTFYYSKNDGAGYKAKDISVSQMGTEFTVVTPDGEEERFTMKLIGAHNVINVVGAIGVAHSLGMSLKELRVPVRRIQPVEHRMEMKPHGDVTIIDDAYNSNPVGSKAAVETLKMFDGIRILITPGMVELGDKEEEYNYKFGTYAADCCDYILLVGAKHTKPIYDGVLSKDFPQEKLFVFDKLEEALNQAYRIKGQGQKYILLENDLPDNY